MADTDNQSHNMLHVILKMSTVRKRSYQYPGMHSVIIFSTCKPLIISGFRFGYMSVDGCNNSQKKKGCANSPKRDPTQRFCVLCFGVGLSATSNRTFPVFIRLQPPLHFDYGFHSTRFMLWIIIPVSNEYCYADTFYGCTPKFRCWEHLTEVRR